MNDFSKQVIQYEDELTALDRTLLTGKCERLLNKALNSIGENIDGMLTPGVKICKTDNIMMYIRTSVERMTEADDLIESMHKLGRMEKENIDFYSDTMNDLKTRHDYIVDYINTKCECTHV